MAAAKTDRGIPLSTLSIKFLHTNSTSHTGPFSATAELIDNAYDPDVDAKQIWIDKTQIRDMECLTFRDDGNGLSRDLMHQMLSFGFSEKEPVKGKLPIGMYGNGFKSGSMRLGQDVIVLSKSKNGMCVGMLSQTYLEKIVAKHIAVPIISFNIQEADNGSGMWENRASLRDILEHSPFNTEEELLTELRAIEGPTGTKIIIWNLRRTFEGNTELDFTTENDIRIPCDDSDPESNSSLRAYCSILYLKPSMQINIQGKKLETHPISESLEYINTTYSYKPNGVNKKIPITFGDNGSKEHYGLMMYHNNRLIKAYHRVGCQLKTKHKISIGVIGVIECNYLKPTHNKQDFDNTDSYRNTIKSVAYKLREYSGKRNNPSDDAPIEEPNDEMTDEDDESEETPGKGASASSLTTSSSQPVITEVFSLSKPPSRLQSTTPQNESRRQKLGGLKRKLVTDMSLSSFTTQRDRLLEANRSLTQEKQDQAAQIDELNLKVVQLEGEKASLSEECKQKTKRTMAAAQMERGVPLSTLCPKYLHTNSTSHTWPFSAIAELIDNAYDPDVNAKQIWIDKTQIKDMECLTFMDNGNGLSSDMMHLMLSFGYSDKKAVNGKHPIGMYGNGFKSGSMRLGQDAIVLSKSKNDLCVGMLSQTYLKKIGAKQITVPIISIKKPEAKHYILLSMSNGLTLCSWSLL
ncbi:unnamed protein product [Boreogadus saida]